MTFVKRHIDVEFQLVADGLVGGASTFEGTNANAVRVAGLRISAVIQKPGGRVASSATLKIYGLRLSVMNQLSTLGKPLPAVNRNKVRIYAYDHGQPPALVFQGEIQYAWSDMNAQPDVAFNVQAYTGLDSAVQPVAPTSYAAGCDVATAIGAIAGQMNMPLENNGVTAKLPISYFPGTATAQLWSCAGAAQINALIDDQVVAIWENGGSRAGDPVPVSKETGMISYPAWTENGISVRTLMNSSVRIGGQILVDSEIVPARGSWNVYSLAHVLDAETPEGQWFTQIECSILGRPLPIG